MKLYSNVVDKEFEVKTYDAGAGKRGICQESIERILFNELPDVKHEFEVKTATANYSAVVFEIKDKNGRKVYGVNDVNVENTDIEGEFTKKHPLIQAYQSAMSTALKSYLGWPNLMDSSYSGPAKVSVIDDSSLVLPPDDVIETNESELESNENTAVTEKTQTQEISKDEFGMNPPEEPEKVEEKETEKKEELDSLIEKYKDISTEELGNTKVGTGTYKNKTYNEMWEEKPSWFNFIETKGKSEKYEPAREFARRKKIE